MNEGTLAILTILAMIGAGITVVWYRDLIFRTDDPPARPAARPRAGARAPRSAPGQPAPARRPGARPAPPASRLAAPGRQADTRPAAPARPPVSPARAPGPEMTPKWGETVSPPVSGVAMPHDAAEMVLFRGLAKLVRAKVITETAALETVFDVRAGSGKAYTAVRAKLKTALAELESTDAPDDDLAPIPLP